MNLPLVTRQSSGGMPLTLTRKVPSPNPWEPGASSQVCPTNSFKEPK